MNDKIYILTSIEYMTCQHTGFNTDTKIIRVFDQKPDIAQLAPHLILSNLMGEAIAQVSEILKTGSVEIYTSLEYELNAWSLNTGKKIDV